MRSSSSHTVKKRGAGFENCSCVPVNFLLVRVGFLAYPLLIISPSSASLYGTITVGLGICHRRTQSNSVKLSQLFPHKSKLQCSSINTPKKNSNSTMKEAKRSFQVYYYVQRRQIDTIECGWLGLVSEQNWREYQKLSLDSWVTKTHYSNPLLKRILYPNQLPTSLIVKLPSFPLVSILWCIFTIS